MAAIPNLFEFVISEALSQEGATAETVAAAIAVSDPFLKAVRIGMERGAEENSVPEKFVLGTLSKAFSAGTANQMFDE